MAGKSNFTADEWQQIAQAPFMVAQYVSQASKGGAIGTIKEVMALLQSLGPSNVADQGQLVKDLVADVSAKAVDVSGGGVERSADTIKGGLGAAMALLDSKAPDEAAGFRQWLYSLAVKVAEASKEGGFMGVGGTKVSAEEQAALTELAATLGVQAS